MLCAPLIKIFIPSYRGAVTAVRGHLLPAVYFVGLGRCASDSQSLCNSKGASSAEAAASESAWVFAIWRLSH